MAKTYKPLTGTTKRGTRSEALVGMGDVLDRLTDLAAVAGDMSPAWRELGSMWQRHMEGVFASSGNGRWVNFAPSTIRAHESALVDEGVMRDGMTSATPRYDDKHMVAFGPRKGNRRVSNVAMLNTVGHRRGSRQVPKRPVVPSLTAGERRQWLGVIERHIAEAVND